MARFRVSYEINLEARGSDGEMNGGSLAPIEPTADTTELLAAELRARAEVADARDYSVAVLKNVAATIPGVGTFVAAALDVQRQRRLERLEQAVKDLAEEVRGLGPKVDMSRHDPERLADIFEGWAERVTHVGSDGRRRRLVAFMRENFVSPVTTESFDERMDFLRDLDALTDTEALVLGRISGPNPPRNLGALTAGDYQAKRALKDAVQKLRGKGLIIQPANRDQTPEANVPLTLTAYGRGFCRFFLNTAG